MNIHTRGILKQAWTCFKWGLICDAFINKAIDGSVYFLMGWCVLLGCLGYWMDYRAEWRKKNPPM